MGVADKLRASSDIAKNEGEGREGRGGDNGETDGGREERKQNKNGN